MTAKIDVASERNSPMNAIKAMVRNGRIETDGPLDLPEGTKLLILRSDTAPARDGEAGFMTRELL